MLHEIFLDISSVISSDLIDSYLLWKELQNLYNYNYRPQVKVMFSHVSVCPQSALWLFVHCSALLRSGRYSSYWNAVLFEIVTTYMYFLHKFCVSEFHVMSRDFILVKQILTQKVFLLTILIFKHFLRFLRFLVTSLLGSVHGLELQIGTMKEFSGGYHLHQIIPHRLQLGLVSQKHTATSPKVNREILTVNLCFG